MPVSRVAVVRRGMIAAALLWGWFEVGLSLNALPSVDDGLNVQMGVWSGGAAVFVNLAQAAVAVALVGWLAWCTAIAFEQPSAQGLATVAGWFVLAVAAQAAATTALDWAAAQVALPAHRWWAQLSLRQFQRNLAPSGVLGAISLIVIVLTLFRAHVVAQRQGAELARTEAAHAQIAMLRYQLNPHFLFNTLNAISSLVVTRRNDEAEEMLAKLSGFLRASLATAPEGTVPLDAEIDMLQDYAEIESVRFGERLAVDFDVDDDLRGAAVPSLILQPLVENAIKYAVEPATRPVRVTVSARRAGDQVELGVADDGEGLQSRRPGTGTGLANIRARLAALYGGRAALETRARPEGGFTATVRVPVDGH